MLYNIAEMINFYHRSVRDKNLSSRDEFIAGSWINVVDPNDAEIKTLAKKFKLNGGLIRDALDPLESSRLEKEKGSIYIFIRVPKITKDSRVGTMPVLIIVGHDFVATVSKEKVDFLDVFLGDMVTFSTTQKTKFVLQILMQVDRAYNHFIREENRRILSNPVELEKINNKDIIQFVVFEEILNEFITSLVPMNINLKKLLDGKFLDLYAEDKDLVEDLLLSIEQLLRRCQTHIRNISSIREAYSTVVSNNLNQLIKVLTVITIILAIPTVIGTFYGMNLPLPFSDSPQAFYFIVALTVAIITAVVYLFIKKRWL